jgi:putative ABC transport system permease protein
VPEKRAAGSGGARGDGEEPRWRRYLRLWGPDPRSDVDDELAFHLEERVRLNVARGLTPEQARAAAQQRFGDAARIRRECLMEQQHVARGAGPGERLRDAAGDVRLAVRALGRAPVFTLTAGLALALGIGASTAVFTVLSAVLLRPLPYAEPERVVAVHNSWEGEQAGALSPAEYFDYAEQVRAFAAVGVYALAHANLIEGDVAERLPAAVVTPSAFTTLGVAASAGRLFSEAEGIPGSDPVVVLSHELWQRRFHGDARVLGRDILVNGTSMTVIGVLPAGVRLPATFAAAAPPALFVPYRLDRAGERARSSHFLHGVARLAPGWTVEAAAAEVSRVARLLAASHPAEYPPAMRFDAFVRPIHAHVVGEARPLLLMLSAAVALVLLIACANVSSLVLTRTEDRRRELAVRSALGAGRWRIARQLLTEHLVLALLAGGAGLLIAYAGVYALRLLQPGDIPRLSEAAIDGGVVAFTLGLSLLVTLLVALAPVRLGGPAFDGLREAGGRTTTGRSSQRLRRGLITGEVALCVVLLAGAGLLLRSFTALTAVDPGYRTERLLTVPISLPPSDYPTDEQRRAFFAALVEGAAALPGAVAAGAVANLPLVAPTGDLSIRMEGREVIEGDVSPRLDWQVVTPGWVEAMGVHILRGRGISAADDATAPGAVVLSEAAARRHWPDGDALGQRFRLGGDAGPGWVSVVGIARDIRHASLVEEPPAIMYLPHAQFTFWAGGAAVGAMTLVVQTAAEPMSVLPALRDLVRGLDPHVPLGAARSMEQVVSTAVAEPRFASRVLAGFALVALLLAMIGIYGLVGYTVSRRTPEIAVRMALGAPPRDVVRHFVVQGMAPVLAGIVIGATAALALGRTIAHMLHDVAPDDPRVLAAAVSLLAASALLACVLPARRAAAVAPLDALRGD